MSDEQRSNFHTWRDCQSHSPGERCDMIRVRRRIRGPLVVVLNSHPSQRLDAGNKQTMQILHITHVHATHTHSPPFLFLLLRNSFYEIWDRMKSASTMSNLAGKKTLSSNIGAIQLRVHYRYQKPPQDENPEPPMSIVPAPRISNELEVDSDFLAQLSEAMMDEASDTRFQKYEDPENKESGTKQQSELKFATVDDDETVVQYPILDMVGSWTIAPETQKVVKAVIRIASAFVSSPRSVGRNGYQRTG